MCVSTKFSSKRHLVQVYFESFFIGTMGPKKAMKAMKSGLEKPAMKSGLGKSPMKSALGKAVKKQIAKPKAKGQASRNKTN